MYTFVVASLMGCAPTPADVKFAGEETVTVHTVDPVQVHAATVLDAEGKALATQPELKWTVTPDGVAKLEGDKVVPVANGKAAVKACATDALCKEYHLVVALPDKVVISAPEGAAWTVGANNTLSAKVLSGETEVSGQKVTWTTDNPAIVTVDENTGAVTAVAVGAANVTATSGTLTHVFPITVAEAPAAPPSN